MGGSRAEMRAVDLVEVDASDDVVLLLVEDTAHRRRRRPPVRALLASAVVAALAAGTTSLVSDRREAERREAVAALPGALRPVAGPVVEQWRSDERLWPDLAPVAGMLVGVTDVGVGVQALAAVAVDAATGETRWRTQIVPASSAPVGGASCVVPEAAEGPGVVVCLAVDELEPSPQNLSVLVPSDARVIVLSAATGEVLS